MYVIKKPSNQIWASFQIKSHHRSFMVSVFPFLHLLQGLHLTGQLTQSRAACHWSHVFKLPASHRRKRGKERAGFCLLRLPGSSTQESRQHSSFAELPQWDFSPGGSCTDSSFPQTPWPGEAKAEGEIGLQLGLMAICNHFGRDLCHGVLSLWAWFIRSTSSKQYCTVRHHFIFS